MSSSPRAGKRLDIWYLDIFAGKNNYVAADNGGSAGHKEINRTTLTLQDIEQGLKKDIVMNQLKLLRLRNTSKAFSGNMTINTTSDNEIDLSWVHNNESAQLKANLNSHEFIINYTENGENKSMTF